MSELNATAKYDLVFSATYQGKSIGPKFAVQIAYPSKTGLVKWMFEILSLLKLRGSPVASLGTKFVPGPALALAGSSPVRPTLPAGLLIQLPFSVAGTYSSKGSSSASVSKTQAYDYKLYDAAQVTDNGTVLYPGASYTATWVDDRVGVTLPKWRSIIDSGGNATTDLIAHRGTMAGMPGYMSVWFKRSYDVKEQCMAVSGILSQAVPMDFVVGGLESRVDAKALSKLNEKLWNLQHDARIGETLGEFRQSLAMIGKPLTGLRDLVSLYERRKLQVIRDKMSRYGKDPRRFDRRHAQELQKALASIYLEFNFGWLPLAKDVLAAIAAAQTVRNKVATKVTASYVDDALHSDQMVPDLVNNYCYFNSRHVKQSRITIRYQVGINPSKVDVLSYVERLGLTPGEFVPTIYAIMPYSWLLDYFTGINASIDALCADISFVSWQSKTVRRTSSYEVVSAPDVAQARSVLEASFLRADGSPSVSRSAMITVQRSVPTTLTPLPTLSVPKSWKPWLNIAALFLQKKIANGGAGVMLASQQFLN